MMTKADEIGTVGYSDRMYSDFMWPFYLVLLFAVELHGSIGLYRLCVKWGWFEGDNAKQTRAKLKKVKWAITVFFLGLGLLTLAAYVKYGYEYSNGLVDKYNSATQIEKFLKVGK
ncbi:MAG: succinate dehydrogenase/fumarate reductase cytochrome b subunit, partial [Sulfurospirillaceae bacterium]|nr:succinate dehydrogenase/fumarate reductase cytochrome b subunit [Sulfurospirillaceae bacterium]